jgi:ComF family protein
MTPALPEIPARQRTFSDRFRHGLEAVADFFLPPVCPACVRRLLPGEYGLCADCLERLEVPQPPLCATCGKPRPIRKGPDRCESCADLAGDGFDTARAAFLYVTPLVDVIHHLKYHRYEEIAEFLGRWLFLFWKDKWKEAGEVDVIVPVPLHPRRLWRRGFNQSESLAGVLSRLSGTDMATSCLKRVRSTKSQTRLDSRQRIRNVAGAFKVVYPPAIENRRILLVDDVLTTGATLWSASGTLKRSGASSVMALTLARTP